MEVVGTLVERSLTFRFEIVGRFLLRCRILIFWKMWVYNNEENFERVAALFLCDEEAHGDKQMSFRS